MSQSYIYLKRRLVKEGIVLAILVIALGVAGFMLQLQMEDADSEQRGVENEVNSQQSKLVQMRQEFASGKEQVANFEKFSKTHSSNFSLNRENTNKWLAMQRENYHLVNMAITIPPFMDVSSTTAPLKSGTLFRSDVKLTFGALTDNSVFAFLAHLQREMPGIVVIQDLKITKNSDINSNVLLDLNRHRITPLVNAEVLISWFGIRPEVKGPVANAK